MSEDFKQKPGHYAAHRPTYPPELFRWLASISPSTNCAWDCATGAGQAAVGLADYFETILATDINQEQVDHAALHPRIRYSVSPAEHPSIPSASVDLITVACAIHWFDRDCFFEAVRRVLTPRGVLAVWTYSWPWTGSRRVDEVLSHLKESVLAGFWPDEAQLYLNGYTDLDFPFSEVDVPPFGLGCDWNVDGLLGFLSTWSAVQRFSRSSGGNPLDQIESALREAWQVEPPPSPLKLPLYFRVGRYLQKESD